MCVFQSISSVAVYLSPWNSGFAIWFPCSRAYSGSLLPNTLIPHSPPASTQLYFIFFLLTFYYTPNVSLSGTWVAFHYPTSTLLPPLSSPLWLPHIYPECPYCSPLSVQILSVLQDPAQIPPFKYFILHPTHPLLFIWFFWYRSLVSCNIFSVFIGNMHMVQIQNLQNCFPPTSAQLPVFLPESNHSYKFLYPFKYIPNLFNHSFI